MLKLININKTYQTGTDSVVALKGISIEFPASGFVSILGPSGCGKTTMLNIIGGLDRYTSGDLIIGGRTTKEFKDSDWDAYRNNAIGFVFQSYNLIGHLNVLDNVQMSMTLSGVGFSERKRRAEVALEKVGLSDKLTKKPNELSGGQMQRVAIARALVNNPEIVLADEPTGAVDTETSVGIMELLKELSKDRLVMMVTHNPELAETYSTRIIKMKDGLVESDSEAAAERLVTSDITSNATTSAAVGAAASDTTADTPLIKAKFKKPSMSFLTALKLSGKNLLTKKGRTIITAIAGSIGIIGVSVVLAMSSGMSAYMSNIQRDMLADLPISIRTGTDMSDTIGSMQDLNLGGKKYDVDDDVITTYDPVEEARSKSHVSIITEDYYDYIRGNEAKGYAGVDKALISGIRYSRGMAIRLVAGIGEGAGASYADYSNKGNASFQEMPATEAFTTSQYKLIQGRYPQSYDEIVLIVDGQNRITYTLTEQLGIAAETGKKLNLTDFENAKLCVVLNDSYYTKSGGYFLVNNDKGAVFNAAGSIPLKFVGILRADDKGLMDTGLLRQGFAYTPELTDKVLEEQLKTEIVKAQIAAPTVDVLNNGNPLAESAYPGRIRSLGGTVIPTQIDIYPATFDSKDKIKKYLELYNKDKEPVDQVNFSDLALLIGRNVGTMINTVSIVLIAFAAVSLVVSSVMIGIITYVSVIERTKEIGILRALGARKTDIRWVFNAETIIVGFVAGTIGVLVTLLLQIPLNSIINKLAGMAIGIVALPWYFAIMMVAISTVLTFVAGTIPSNMAAKKDPVKALRTE